jgi:outer membrane protein assembly factor BamB
VGPLRGGKRVVGGRAFFISALAGIAFWSAAAAGAEPLRPTADSWPVFRGDGGLTGVSPVSLPPKLTLRWTFKTAAPVRSSAVIGGGRVFIGSSDGTLYALALSSGEKLWGYAAGSPVEAPPLLDGAALYAGTAAGELLCLDAASGKRR